MPSPPLSAEALGEQLHVSRETLERLTVYLELLRRWQGAVNLVGRGTLADPWRRHVLDCAQLAPHVPAGAATVVDLGSGAGFPGMVLSIMGLRGVHLIESDRRKAQFLREVARATGASVQVHAERIERMCGWSADVITARALAPLPRLLVLTERFMTSDSVCLFLKGRSGARELTEARVTWHMEAEMFPSRSEPTGMVLQLRGIRRARHRQS
ncbi:MAG TPA: 16S rRNA (guanine(527)-N(7))-methyltransferase RsmG [Geminicoccaceae bacterium]|nr:16S rRNA (guanine(527)-N(7))-methyltransferase RsmG [Geminicoccaceae bacterium]